jgi:multisubunit Na+/H+ antiporter MnhG subunit
VNLAVDGLLGIGVALELLCCIGVVVMRTPIDRLHYASAGIVVPPLFVLAAVLIREHVSSGGLQAIAAVALLVLLNPVLLNATARAIRRVDVPQGEP